MPIWMLIVFLAFSAVVLYAAGALHKKGGKQSAKACIASYVMFTLIFLVIWIFSFSVPPYILLLAMLAVFVSCFFGYYFNWYNRSIVFDRYLHAYGSLSFALLAFSMVQNLFETGGSRAFQGLFVVTLGMAIGAAFELVEAAIDVKKRQKGQPGPDAQRGLADTDFDLVGNCIGSLVAGVFAFFVLLA